MPELPIVQLTHRPGVLDLGWGHPDPALLPVEAMRRAAEGALARHGADALAYGMERGPGPLVSWLIERTAAREGRAPSPDEVVITGGASHGLDLICTLLARPGDVALVESPTYHLAVRVLRDHPLHLVPVQADEGGLRVDTLAEALAALRREGRAARLLYTVPTFHNPTGACLALERRRALVELAAEEGFLIVEDDVYRELAYDAPPPPSLWSLAPPGTVARLGSFAKTLAPGLRLGWITAGAADVARITGCGLLDSGGGLNHFTAVTVSALCAAGDFDAQVARLRAAYRERRDALATALRAHLPPGCAVHPPGGGFFQWVQLPEGLDAAELLPRAEATGVAYIPGARFHLDGRGANTLRLAFSLYPPAELREAARRLGEALRT
ncbi:MAG TPA: PLP-dependent aminotransferase family protein [Roseiflexaceae bacterium]|nr:PLP-dependent aminotransferase family protein [Roseiflexaceae bacterium]